MAATLKDVLEGIGGALQVGANLLFAPLLRGWRSRWGATADEAGRALPGDEIVPRPRTRYTRAITIHAPASAVWPWLAQMGQGRGGLYSYDWLENLVGCDIHSADRIVPDLQAIAVGDSVRLGPEGYPLFKVEAVEPGRALVLIAADPRTGEVARYTDPPPEQYTVSSWLFYLDLVDERTTRLIARGQLDYNPSFANRLLWGITDVVGFVMERRMLRGIKQRAEAAA